MRAHDEHGDREFRKAPRAAHRVGRAEARPSGEGEDSARDRVTDSAAQAKESLGGRAFRVRLEALEQLQRRIEALGRRAHRLGMEPLMLLDTGERDVHGHAFVVLQGRAPVLAGWTLAAIVDHRDGHPTVRPVSEQGERLAPDVFASARCEHCLLRRHRTRTYVVVHARAASCDR